MALFATKYLAFGVTLLVSSIAGAQAAPAKPACDVGESATGNAARATLSVNLAREATSPAVAGTNLKNAVKLLETAAPGDNAVTNAYVMGEALSLWANQPGVGLTPTRGSLGFATNAAATLDIPITIDSLFKIVETAKPNCTDYTAYWRAGQKFYLELVNGAINAMNGDKLDSAEYYATQANRLYGQSPYGTMILGGVASKRGNTARAVEYWTKAAEAANRDTSYRDVHRQMLANVGSAYLDQGGTATGAEKVAAYRKAAEVYSQLIAIPGTKGQYLTGSRQQLETAYLMAGDTAAAALVWAPLLANPSGYEYNDLLNSAVNAARANRSADAGKLFEATLAQNPYNRDALFNVAVTYLTMEQNDKIGPIVERLVAVDPGNPDNFNLAARAYLALGKAATTAKKAALAGAYNDSTVSWYNRGNSLPVEVTFTEFSPNDKNVTIAGSVLDRRDKIEANAQQPAAAAKPAKGAKAKAAAKPEAKTFPAKPVTLSFTALDKAGQALGTETVTTEPLAPGQRAKFKFTINVPNVAAYRYKIVD
ncbi:MAG: FxLYD domain-containing protein [Gemmatimonadota bacterium]|nr:FxLYD domain-containing protein [Gemmatimonadota bacterium]